MLSHIYRLARQFEHTHQLRPNLLYLNPGHLEHLREAFANPRDMGEILELLQMELIIDREVIHPHVAWSAKLLRRAS